MAIACRPAGQFHGAVRRDWRCCDRARTCHRHWLPMVGFTRGFNGMAVAVERHVRAHRERRVDTRPRDAVLRGRSGDAEARLDSCRVRRGAYTAGPRRGELLVHGGQHSWRFDIALPVHVLFLGGYRGPVGQKLSRNQSGHRRSGHGVWRHHFDRRLDGGRARACNARHRSGRRLSSITIDADPDIRLLGLRPVRCLARHRLLRRRTRGWAATGLSGGARVWMELGRKPQATRRSRLQCRLHGIIVSGRHPHHAWPGSAEAHHFFHGADRRQPAADGNSFPFSAERQALCRRAPQRHRLECRGDLHHRAWFRARRGDHSLQIFGGT